jgi:hypothetical protein
VSWFGRIVDRLSGRPELPPGFTGTLDPEEHVLASAEFRGGHLVATSLGLWLPDGPRRVGWHLISKATWSGDALTLIEATESGHAGDAVLLTDQPPRRYPLTEPGKLPEIVHRKVTGSIRSTHHRDLPGGGAWFVQRAIPGHDGNTLQVRTDPGTDESVVSAIAAEVAAKLPKTTP